MLTAPPLCVPVAAVILALLVGAGCATTSGALALPGNWDDHYLDLAVGKSSVRPPLAVLPFTGAERYREVGDIQIGDILATTLFKTGRFQMVERTKLNEILKEQKFQRSGSVDESTAVQIGKLVGASTVVVGTLSRASQQKIDKFAFDVIYTTVRIDARAVDTATGRLIFTESAEGQSELRVVTDSRGNIVTGPKSAQEAQPEYLKAATAATAALSEKLGKQFPVVGFVLSVNQSRFVTDIGSDRELAPKDRLLLIRPIERIIHPITNKPVGWNKKILGLAEVQTVEVSTSTAQVIRIEGQEAIKPGDLTVVQPKN